MEPFESFTGIVCPLDRSNVDTDAIIPKQFLKSIKRSGFGPNLFDEWRYLDIGEPGMDNSQRPLNPDFVLNLAFLVMVAGVVGARLFYAIFHWPDFSDNLLGIFNPFGASEGFGIAGPRKKAVGGEASSSATPVAMTPAGSDGSLSLPLKSVAVTLYQ